MTSTPVADRLRTLLPDTCIQIHGSFDLNRDWPCKRAQHLYSLDVFANNIAQTEVRAQRAHGYRAQNLAKWIADADARFTRLVAQVLPELPECTGRVGNGCGC